MRECWINIYPHGIGYHCFAYKYQAEEASKGKRYPRRCYAIYRIHVKLK